MADPMRLFGRGLRWSYREYGLKGVAVFVAVVAVGYYMVDQQFDDVLSGETQFELDLSDLKSDDGPDSGPGQ
jgi:hypothetical protein